MEAQIEKNHDDAEIIASLQGDMSMELHPLVQMESNELKKTVMEVLNKRIMRNPRYCGMNITDLGDVTVHRDNNMTFVVIDMAGDRVVGWAKFNPKDIRIIDGKSKKGNYWFRKESKYRPNAGLMKAIDRAVEQILNP